MLSRIQVIPITILYGFYCNSIQEIKPNWIMMYIRSHLIDSKVLSFILNILLLFFNVSPYLSIIKTYWTISLKLLIQQTAGNEGKWNKLTATSQYACGRKIYLFHRAFKILLVASNQRKPTLKKILIQKTTQALNEELSRLF